MGEFSLQIRGISYLIVPIFNLSLLFPLSSQSSALEWHLEGRVDLRMPFAALQGFAQSHGEVSFIVWCISVGFLYNFPLFFQQICAHQGHCALWQMVCAALHLQRFTLWTQVSFILPLPYLPLSFQHTCWMLAIHTRHVPHEFVALSLSHILDKKFQDWNSVPTQRSLCAGIVLPATV